jgi:hypothetical protein
LSKASEPVTSAAKALLRTKALNPTEMRAYPAIAWQRALHSSESDVDGRNTRGINHGSGRLPTTRGPSSWMPLASLGMTQPILAFVFLVAFEVGGGGVETAPRLQG